MAIDTPAAIALIEILRDPQNAADLARAMDRWGIGSMEVHRVLHECLFAAEINAGMMQAERNNTSALYR
jgi:hypothetical protein